MNNILNTKGLNGGRRALKISDAKQSFLFLFNIFNDLLDKIIDLD